jgi:hypothetical protein
MHQVIEQGLIGFAMRQEVVLACSPPCMQLLCVKQWFSLAVVLHAPPGDNYTGFAAQVWPIGVKPVLSPTRLKRKTMP